MRPGLARVGSALVAALAVTAAPARAGADDVTASGSVGAGVFAGQAASTAELGVDVAGAGYAVGLGAGARFLAEGGFRGEEWDEASEWARVVRYALWRWPGGGTGADDLGGAQGDDGLAWAAAAVGELGGVTLGHGALIDRFSGGLDVDHGRVGIQLGAGRGRVTGELVVDDVVAPRIAGARVAMRSGRRLVLGVSAAGDLTAPSMASSGPGGAGNGASLDTGGGEAVGALAVDGELVAESARGSRGALHADLVHVLDLGVGLHVGVRGLADVGESFRVGADLELRAGSDRYLPGWIGPLYERDRRELIAADGSMSGGQLDAARAGGLGGLGAAARLDVEAIDRVGASFGYAARPGLADLVTARIAAPHRARAQAALWAAAEVDGQEVEAMALAVELRVRLAGRWFVRADAARLFQQEDDGRFAPVWLGQLALGSMLGSGSDRD